MTFQPTPGWELDFDRLTPHIAAALGYTGGTHTLENVRQKIADGLLQFWPAANSCLITELYDAPSGLRVLHFFLGAGTLEEIKPFYRIVLDWGRSQGCSIASFTGRAGWERTFLTKEDGWRPTATHFTKEM